MRPARTRLLALVAMLTASMIGGGILGGGATAAGPTVLVLPDNTEWTTADTRPGGEVLFVPDPTSPLPTGALQLKNTVATTAKAQYLHLANTPLSAVTELGFWSKGIAGPDKAAPSYQLIVHLDGNPTLGTTPPNPTFTTFVWEPYQNGTVIPNTWQPWDVDQGTFWSSRSVTIAASTCVVGAGFGGPPFYSLGQLQTMCPSAVVVGFGVNIGSNNPGWDVYADAVNFNGTTYDFELVPPPVGPPVDKAECKKGGWETFDTPRHFENQGDCIQFVNTGK